MLDTVAVTLDRSAPPDPPAACGRSLCGRDEFGPIAGPLGFFSAPVTALGLAREDLGHALCGWAPREDLL